MTTWKRALSALAASALVLPLLASSASAAPGDTPIPALQGIDVFCTNPTAAQFSDVVAGGDANADELALAIRCLATAGIAQGFTNGTYGPQQPVTRGQMASFIARMVDAASRRERTAGSVRELPAPAAGNPFAGDVASNDFRLNDIKRLSQARIVTGNPGTATQPQGIGADKYGPELPVTRSQMASFLNRAVAYVTGGDPARAGTTGNGFAAPTAEYYVDAQQATHAANVNGITSAGISNGVGGKRYDGLAGVSRQQMARFIARTLSDLYDQDRVFTLLEALTSTIAASGRTDSNRNTGSGTGSTRVLEFTGLTPNTDYRLTLVRCGNVSRGSNDVVTFTRNADGTVNAGAPTTRILGVGRGQSGDDAPAGTTNTLVINSQSGTAFSVLIGEATAPECVVAVLTFNGGAGRSLDQGGTNPALELDSAGRPTEPLGITGRTTFGNPPPSGTATVTTSASTVRGGEPVVGEVTADQPITGVTVAGDCVDGGAVADTDAAQPGVQFSVPTDEFAAQGDCDLTFTTTFQNGTSDEDVVTVTVDSEGPFFQRVESASGLATIVVFFDEPVDCATVDADGSDFALTTFEGDAEVPVDVVSAACDGDGAVTLTAERPFEDGEFFLLERVAGTVVADPAGNEQFDDDITFFTVGAPLIEETSATEGGGQDGVVDAGDSLSLLFSEPVRFDNSDVPTIVFVVDEDGDSTEIQCAAAGTLVPADRTEAQCALSADGTRLTLVLTEDAVVSRSEGTDGVLRFPLEIFDVSNVVDADFNFVDVVNSPDTLIEVSA